VWPTKRGARGFVGIGKIALTQARIDGLFNKSSPCSSRLYVPKPTPDGICKRPGLLYTEFGYFSRSKNRSTHHSEGRRAGLFKSALGVALKNGAKWMSLYHATEEQDLSRPEDYGIFAVDGTVRGTRPFGKGPRPGYANPQRRRTYCDGIRAFAMLEKYPTEAAPCD